MLESVFVRGVVCDLKKTYATYFASNAFLFSSLTTFTFLDLFSFSSKSFILHMSFSYRDVVSSSEPEMDLDSFILKKIQKLKRKKFVSAEHHQHGEFQHVTNWKSLSLSLKILPRVSV